MGLLVATSDGGFLGCLAAIAVIMVLSSRNLVKFARFFLSLAIAMFGAKIIWIIELITNGGSKGYTSFSEFFVYNDAIFIIMAVSVAMFVVLYFGNMLNIIKQLPKATFYILLSLVGLAVAGFITLIVYYSCIDTKTPLTGMMRFFRFDELWGTHRGYFWIKSFEIFGEMNFTEKLIGTGPETLFYGFEPYGSEMVRRFNESSTNAAHNVYINYLITHGILGVTAYLTFVISSIVATLKRTKENPLAFVCAGVIIAYALQDFVNIANPVNTPWFIVFIAMSEATRLRANSSHELAENKF